MPAGHTTDIDRCIQRFNANQPGAREELFRITRDRLLTMVRGMMADFQRLRRWEQSDDVLHEVQVRLLDSLAKQPVESARSFFGRAAAHMRWELIDLSRHYYGKHGRGKNHATPAADAEYDGRPDLEVEADETDPSGLLEFAELHEAVAKLPDDEREVVELRLYHGLTYREIAELIGVSTKTVIRRSVSARSALAACLSQPVLV